MVKYRETKTQIETTAYPSKKMFAINIIFISISIFLASSADVKPTCVSQF